MIALAQNRFTTLFPFFQLQRILAQLAGDTVDDVFDRYRALRPTKTAKCSIRNRVGLAAMRQDADVLEKISIVATEHCTIVHRLGRVELEQASIAIAVSTPHRNDAFEAGRWLIDEIKLATMHTRPSTPAMPKPGMTNTSSRSRKIPVTNNAI